MKRLFIILAVVLFVGVPVGVCLYINNDNESNKVHARDLGVRPNKQDLVSAEAKFNQLEAGEPATLDSAELTAWLKLHKTKAAPLVETQVKINPDEDIEISGLLVTDNLESYASDNGLSAEQARQTADQLGRNRLVPLYIRCQGGMNDGRLDLTIKAIEVDDTGVPRFMIRDKQNEIERILQEVLQRNQIRDIRVENREIKLQFNTDA